MKTIKCLIVCLVFVNILQAQSENIFWERDFWKTNPTIETIEEKVKEGHSATALNPFGFDAVVYAILEKAPNKSIKYLLSKEENDVNKLTHDKRTYIFWAAYKSNMELMKYLISKNAKMDLKDAHHFSVLTFAAVAGITNLDIYDLCIEHGIDIKNDVDEHGANALLLLMPHLKDFEVANYFMKKGLSLKSKDSDGNGVFNYTAKAGNKIMLEKLIERGISHKLNNKGGNAMLLATRGSRSGYNALDFFKYLEGLGIEANIVNNDGITPLHNLAYGNKDLETFNYFISKGVDVNQIDKDGNTALINASGRNSLGIITKLAENTKNINHVNNNGQSALTKSIGNAPQTISFLIKKGADVHVIDTRGNNLSYYLIKSFQAKKQETFNQKLKVLSNNGFDVTTIQKNGNTLFHLAVDADNIDLLKYVNALGVDINIKNKDGLTALHMSVMKAKNLKILKYLLSIGANKNIKTDFEESVYDLAKENELLNTHHIDFLK
ncbi:ankyrin repeat domain-containing protein [Flavivirga spongiicola]|uniref:Ankyrin repeat domain-containing protein n=1 Tax=Flavivirga spongiicola TaxID=421621 RepID=A0ABU7XTF5_9FLAO|nr:ankyrin repeat domain-containing protein [Flavivirga sp. MEBiC05379]MDO5979072.1 ankyrin repeat domain-containing protein [Flavivirga sp. MEBiC05379]